VSLWTLAHSRQAELMDDPALATAEYLQALSALGRINALSRTASQLAAAIVRIRTAGSGLGLADCTDMVAHNRNAPRPIHVIDVACGGGDITVALARRLNRLLTRSGNPTSQSVHVTGIDVSPRAIQRAEALATQSSEINVSFEVRDVVADGCPPCDIATSSLFLHHFDDTTAVQIVRSLASASRCGVVVSDLVRSKLGLWLAMIGTAVLSSSRVARVDGPLSVRAARTPDEYRCLADCAGLPQATVRRVWPERVLLEWTTSLGVA